MVLLHILKKGNSDSNRQLSRLISSSDGSLQSVSHLLDISHSLDLKSLTSALRINNLLSNSLLNAINSLLAAKTDTVILDDLLITVDDLLNVDQAALAQGLIQTLNHLLDNNSSKASVYDVIATVRSSIHQLQAIGDLACYLPTFMLLMTASGATDQSLESLTKKPSQREKAVGLRVLSPIH
ncbi:hypothetical protein VZH09_10425 [Synechococcus elongatus IITB7]|uniref:hypothetical protein n=1 Tax=Synechococcus elongatus TaxID=32046 RepID=UPI0030CEA63F